MVQCKHSRRRGSVLVGLLTVVAIAAFGVGLLLPSLNRARETANRVKCANNLRQIGLAITLYAGDNRGSYPRTKYAGGDKVIPDVTNAGAESPDPFKAGTTVPDNCVPSAFFLLLRTEDITAAVFNCPSTAAQPDLFNGGDAAHRSNFSDLKQYLSYSYADPYPDNGAMKAGLHMLNNALDAGYPIAADKNPGTAGGANVLGVTTMSNAVEIRAANSQNHRQDGQNVLYADCHVEFWATVFCGENQDNIYCRGMGGPNASKDDVVNSPKDINDTVLLPADKD